MSFKVACGNIWEFDVDVITVPHIPCCEYILPEVSTKIYEAAGYVDMLRAYSTAQYEVRMETEEMCDILDDETGVEYKDSPKIVATSGFDLNAKYALHIVVDLETWWSGQPDIIRKETEWKLIQYYRGALEHAQKKLHAKSIAFPLLGSCMLRLPEEFSRAVAEDVIRGWLKQNSGNPIDVFLVLPFAGGMAYPIQPVKTYDKTDVFMTYEKMLSEKTEKSGKDRETFFRETSLGYLDRIESIKSIDNFSGDLGFGKEVIYRFIHKQLGSTNKRDVIPKKYRVIAIAIGMELDDYERFEFIRCAGYHYPVDSLDYQVEKIIRSGTRGFANINEALCLIDPGYDLKKPVKSTKNNEISQR